MVLGITSNVYRDPKTNSYKLSGRSYTNIENVIKFLAKPEGA